MCIGCVLLLLVVVLIRQQLNQFKTCRLLIENARHYCGD